MRAALLRRLLAAPGSPAAARRCFSELAEAEVAAAGPAAWLAASAASGGSLVERHAALVAAGTLKPDPAQQQCVERLDRLLRELQLYTQQARCLTPWCRGAL